MSEEEKEAIESIEHFLPLNLITEVVENQEDSNINNVDLNKKISKKSNVQLEDKELSVDKEDNNSLNDEDEIDNLKFHSISTKRLPAYKLINQNKQKINTGNVNINININNTNNNINNNFIYPEISAIQNYDLTNNKIHNPFQDYYNTEKIGNRHFNSYSFYNINTAESLNHFPQNNQNIQNIQNYSNNNININNNNSYLNKNNINNNEVNLPISALKFSRTPEQTNEYNNYTQYMNINQNFPQIQNFSNLSNFSMSSPISNPIRNLLLFSNINTVNQNLNKELQNSFPNIYQNNQSSNLYLVTNNQNKKSLDGSISSQKTSVDSAKFYLNTPQINNFQNFNINSINNNMNLKTNINLSNNNIINNNNNNSNINNNNNNINININNINNNKNVNNFQNQNNQEEFKYYLNSLKTSIIDYLCTPKGSHEILKKIQKSNNCSIIENKKILLKIIDKRIFRIFTNVYGNYFIQKLIDNTEQSLIELVFENLKDNFIYVCNNENGTYAVQNLISKISDFNYDTQNLILSYIEEKEEKLAFDLYGIHVLKEILKKIKDFNRKKINKFLINNLYKICQDKNGTCLIKILMDTCRLIEDKNEMIEYFLKNFIEISQNPYGNYSMQFLFEIWYDDYEKLIKELKIDLDKKEEYFNNINNNDINNNDINNNDNINNIEEKKNKLINSKNGNEYKFIYLIYNLINKFHNNLIQLSTQKYSSNVIEKLIEIFHEQDKKDLCHKLCLNYENTLLLKNKFGRYVFIKAFRSLESASLKKKSLNLAFSFLNIEKGNLKEKNKILKFLNSLKNEQEEPNI